MKCKICGANLKKEAGDICIKCYKELQEEEDLKKDTNVKLKIKRKYSIQYEISKNILGIIIFIFAFLLCISVGGILEGLGVILIGIIIIGGLMFLDKRIALGTKVVFYEKKVVYNFDFLFIHHEKVVKYTDLRDIKYYQEFRQKRLGLGDLCIYAKGAIPGATLLNGFQIKNVGDIKKVLEQINEIIKENIS